MAKDYADFTTNKYDLAHDIQNKYNQNPSSIENYCFYTPQVSEYQRIDFFCWYLFYNDVVIYNFLAIYDIGFLN